MQIASSMILILTPTVQNPFYPPKPVDAQSFSRFEELTFPEIDEKANRDDQLEEQGDPEPVLPQPVQCVECEVREDRAWPCGIRRAGPGGDGRDRSNHLGEDEGEGDVEARQGLKEDHAEPDSLDGIQHAHPTPQRPPQYRTESRGPPGDVEADPADTPERLAPSRSAEADGEDGDDP